MVLRWKVELDARLSSHHLHLYLFIYWLLEIMRVGWERKKDPLDSLNGEYKIFLVKERSKLYLFNADKINYRCSMKSWVCFCRFADFTFAEFIEKSIQIGYSL